MSILVSVIFVSYNNRALTLKSIKSVFASKGISKEQIEIIVVDNNSTDDTVSYLKKNYPQIKVIPNKKNIGFGAGNNQAAQLARGRYLLFLNTDAFLSYDSLQIMVDVLEKQEGVVSVGPQLRYPDGSIQLSGGYLPSPLKVIAWMWWLDRFPIIKKLFNKPYHVIDKTWHTKPQYPEWLMGACILLRRSEFLSVGGFDEKIFMYAEEVELYHKLKKQVHKKIFFTPKTKVVHIGGASSKKANAYRLIQELKGIEYIYKKHYPQLLYFIKAVIFIGVILRVVAFSFIPSRHETLIEYQKYFKSY